MILEMLNEKYPLKCFVFKMCQQLFGNPVHQLFFTFRQHQTKSEMVHKKYRFPLSAFRGSIYALALD